jgi:dihydropteroate synthase
MFKIVAKDRIWEFKTPQIMAIMNATQDSFYEGSRVNTIDWAVEKAGKFIQEGAQIIDIGGQSTRPGASIHTPQQELNNVLPIIEAVSATYPNLLISVDTFNSIVAEGALQAGAHIVNDISCGMFDENILKVIANYQAAFVGMHITGNQNTMHVIPDRKDIIQEIIAYFNEKKKALANLGIINWIIDPGFGFGKSIADNFTIVKNLKDLSSIELPILLGVSRKSSIYKTLNVTAEEALNGTTVLNTVGILNGVSILRVHDVKEAKEVIELASYLS